MGDFCFRYLSPFRYLNLIERNQRPLSARVLVQVIERFDFDPRELREDEAIGGVDGLARRMADKRFTDLGIDREEVQEFLAAAPQAAAAFARLYDKSHPEEEPIVRVLEGPMAHVSCFQNGLNHPSNPSS